MAATVPEGCRSRPPCVHAWMLLLNITGITQLHVCLTNVIGIILIYNAEHIWDIPVPLPQLVMVASLSAWVHM